MDNSTSIQHLKEEEEGNTTTSIEDLQESENNQQNNSQFSFVDNNKQMAMVPESKDYNSFVIKPPPSRDIFKNKIKNLIIDSRDRNSNIFPSASKFEVPLKEEYKYVKSINLVMAQIPSSQYLVNSSNNLLEYYIGNNTDQKNTGPTEILEIEMGNYPDPNPINNYLPNLLPTLREFNSVILPQGEYFRDLLAVYIQNSLNISLNKCNIFKPVIEVSYIFLKDNYLFNSDLAPLDNKSYTGEKLNLCFKGNQEPHGPQEIDKVPKINNYDRIERDENGQTVYETISIGEKRTLYKKNTIGKVIGFGIENYNGYVINGINNINNPLIFTVKTVTTQNNNFISKNNIKKGIYILLEEKLENSQTYYQRFKIKNIINDYTFEIYDPNNSETGHNAPLIPPGNPDIDGGIYTFTDSSLFSGYVQSPFRKDFSLDRYVILKIRYAHKIDSENSASQNSFAIIPFSFIIDMAKTDDYSDSLWLRSFNPPLPKLAELSFQFLNYNGSTYNFQGQEVTMQFVIETLNQSIKYGS